MGNDGLTIELRDQDGELVDRVPWPEARERVVTYLEAALVGRAPIVTDPAGENVLAAIFTGRSE